MAATMLGSLLVSLGLESGEFKSGLTAAEKQMKAAARNFENIGKKMVGLGKTMSIAITAPVVAMGVKSVQAFRESEKSIATVEAALKSMGDKAGYTSKQLQDMATSLQNNTLFGDEEIMTKVTATLLTFGEISGDVFSRAQAAALDMSTMFGQDLQSSAVMLGKALNDPTTGLSALSRVGLKLTDEQVELVKSMQAVGDMAGAQKVILEGLESQVKGQAHAAMLADGGITQLSNSWGDFQEQIGAVLVEYLTPLVAKLQELMTWLQSLSPETRKVAVTIGLIAAAVGPLLIGFGLAVQAMAPFLGTISVLGKAGGALFAAKAGVAGLTAAFGPFAIAAAAIAAAGYLIYENWDIIGPALKEFWESAKTALGPELQAMVSEITGALSELWNGPLGQGIRDAMRSFAEFYVAYTKAMGPVFIAGLKLVIQTLVAVFKQIGNGIHLVSSLLKGDWSGAWDAAVSIVRTAFGGLPEYVIGVVSRLAQGVREWIVNKLGQIWNTVLDKINLVKNAFYSLYDAVVGHSYIPDMVDGIAAQMARLDAVMVAPVTKATTEAERAFQTMAGNVRGILDRLFPDVAAAMNYNAERAAVSAVMPGGDGERVNRALANEEYLRRMAARPKIDTGANDLTRDFGKVNDAIDALTQKAKVATVKIAESFKDMATNTMSALDSLGKAIKGGGWFDIFNAVLGLGLQLGGTGLFGKGFAAKINSIPGFAGGTNFAPGGMALVGERGPELVNLPRGSQVIPNNQMGGGVTRVEIVDTTGLFRVRVNDQIMDAAPALIEAGGAEGVEKIGRMQGRRLA